MPNKTLLKPNVREAVPFFNVTNMPASLHFYVDGLGFRITHDWTPDDPKVIRWCRLQHGDAGLMLQTWWRDGKPGGWPDGKLGQGVSVCFMCEDALVDPARSDGARSSAVTQSVCRERSLGRQLCRSGRLLHRLRKPDRHCGRDRIRSRRPCLGGSLDDGDSAELDGNRDDQQRNQQDRRRNQRRRDPHLASYSSRPPDRGSSCAPSAVARTVP